jgi:hypothetical protein
MPWSRLLADRKVKTHVPTRREIDDLRSVVARDIADASIESLSSDRRFATAFNAALQLARIAVACAGYRVSATAHHQTSLEAAEIAMGSDVALLMTYFDTCRRRRSVVDYDMSGVVSDTEVREIIERTEHFRALVEAWIAANHPEFAT